MYKKILFFLIQCACITLWAQEVPMGQFKEYLPYNQFKSIAQDSENIYVATNQSVLVVDKQDTSTYKWSNLNGLSDVGVQTIHSDPKGRLIVVYTNSDIDVIKKLKVYNVRDILNKQITGSKTINNISSINDLAYLACDFGVVILDLETLLVKDTWFTIRNSVPYRARFITIHNQRYYLATDKGVFSLPVTAPNPADFSMWEQERELSASSYKILCSYNDKLYAVWDGGSNGDSLFVYENLHWEYDNSMKIKHFRSFEVRDEKMVVCDFNHVQIFSGNSSMRYDWKPTPPNVWQNGCAATIDEKMNVWVADNTSGLIYINAKSKEYKTITAEGPANSNAYGLCLTNGILALVPGARSNAIVPSWNAPAISLLQDDTWWTHTNFKQHKLATGFNSVAINPLNTKEIYMASWNGGLVKINTKTSETFLYNSENSPLITARPTIDSALFVAGLVVDKQNNLWITQSQVTHPIKVKNLNKEDDWYSFSLKFDLTPPPPTTELLVEHILIDSRNYKWITVPRQNRLVVFSENGSLTNTAVHKKTEVDLTSQANVAGNRITCIAEDKDGNIWTGFDQGIKVVYDAGSVFNRRLYAKNIVLEQRIGDTALPQNLLEFEYITCIAVDAANRKWIGTQNAGVFFLSPNGMQELFHFTTSNSPLFSNQINDIVINPENGEVFIATDGGLISYKGTATAGRENYKEAIVYPNPVREDYYGPVAVKGLMENSFCKITDATGNLIWQGYAYGGQLIWNGKDFYGKRPATGVYFVMASSKTAKEKTVAKFMFIQ